MSIQESAYEHVKYKIMNAPILDYPYPHILIEKIFSDEFYQELLEKLPTINEYTLKPKYAGRKTMTLDTLEHLDDGKKNFWAQMEKWLRSSDFSNLLLEKFSIKKKGHSDFFLHKDLEDFEVTPHRDVKSKLVTYLFYLPKDDSLAQLGTQMLIPKKGKTIPDTTDHQDWNDFEIVKSLQYLPNSFFAFKPGKNSFHAVKIKFPENLDKKERDSIRGFVFDKNEPDFPGYIFKN